MEKREIKDEGIGLLLWFLNETVMKQLDCQFCCWGSWIAERSVLCGGSWIGRGKGEG